MFSAHKHYERHLINAAKLVRDNFTVVWKQKSTTGGKDGSAALLFTQPLDKECIITMVYNLQQGTKKSWLFGKGERCFFVGFIVLFFLPSWGIRMEKTEEKTVKCVNTYRLAKQSEKRLTKCIVEGTGPKIWWSCSAKHWVLSAIWVFLESMCCSYTCCNKYEIAKAKRKKKA